MLGGAGGPRPIGGGSRQRYGLKILARITTADYLLLTVCTPLEDSLKLVLMIHAEHFEKNIKIFKKKQ